MKTIITSVGSSIASNLFNKNIKKYFLFGSTSSNDDYLTNLLNSEKNISNIDNLGLLDNYKISENNSIDNSYVDTDGTYNVTIIIRNDMIAIGTYVYAVSLTDEDGNIYTINLFNDPFNAVNNFEEIVTLKFKLSNYDSENGGYIDPNTAETYVTRREFFEWIDTHNHDKNYITVRHLNDTISDIENIKADKSDLGNINNINSLNNSSVVNVINEIIENIGNINNLDIPDRSNIINVINKIYKSIGDSTRLSPEDNIIDALINIKSKLIDLENISFLDGIKVKDVEWREKADLLYTNQVRELLNNKIDTVDSKIGDLDNCVYQGKNVIEKLNTLNSIKADISYIGDLNDFNGYDNSQNNVIDCINTLRDEIHNQPSAEFNDNVRVPDVNWSDKADISYIGDLNDFEGTERDTIVKALNEIRRNIINSSGGNIDKRIILGVNKNSNEILEENTNYLLYDCSKSYDGIISFEFKKNNDIMMRLSLYINSSNSQYLISDLYISSTFMDKKFINRYLNYIYDFSINLFNNNLYLSIDTFRDDKGILNYDTIDIIYSKMNRDIDFKKCDFYSMNPIIIFEGNGNIDNLKDKIVIPINGEESFFSIIDKNKNSNLRVSVKKYGLDYISFDVSSVNGKINVINESIRYFNDNMTTIINYKLKNDKLRKSIKTTLI